MTHNERTKSAEARNKTYDKSNKEFEGHNENIEYDLIQPISVYLIITCNQSPNTIPTCKYNSQIAMQNICLLSTQD